MKRCFIYLICSFALIYLHEGWLILFEKQLTHVYDEANLSAFASEVTAIPLQIEPQHAQHGFSHLKREGNQLFLINNGKLLRFSSSGHFLNSLTTKDLFVQDYVIDTDRKQVIVLDETATLYYFSYTGEKLHQMSFPPIANALRVGKMMCIHGKIWMTIEQETLMSQQSEITKTIEPWLYCFDTSFELIESRRLNMPVNYRNELNFIANPEIGLSDQYIYVQSAAIRPDYLPEDTLSLVANSKLTITKQSSEILPVRIGKRFLFSTRYSDADPTNNYIYCFDQQKQQNYLLREGIYDDFYHTGSIKQLSTLYAEQDTFYYIRQSKTLNPTLYIVRLKTS